ncbi:MAG: hypothetical protein ACT4PZ_24410 [Panacagrimonas sp.]
MRCLQNLLVAFALALALSQSAEARSRDLGVSPPDVRSPESLLDRRSRMGPAQAARVAQKRYGGGKVLGVESADDGYRVKLLRNGDVRIVFVPDR